MAGRDIAQWRRIKPAAPVCERTARREAAAGRLVVGAGYRSFDGGEALAIDVDARDRAEQADRIGMLGIGKKVVDVGALDNAAGIHHQQLVRSEEHTSEL